MSRTGYYFEKMRDYYSVHNINMYLSSAYYSHYGPKFLWSFAATFPGFFDWPVDQREKTKGKLNKNKNERPPHSQVLWKIQYATKKHTERLISRAIDRHSTLAKKMS